MDLLDSLINKHFPSRSLVLSLIDDYTLFCYYLGQDVGLNQAILSPLRTIKADTLPSFVVYPDRKGELRYFDHGTGEGGSVFDLIMNLYGYKSFEEVCSRIGEDFGLDLGTGKLNLDSSKPIFLKATRPPMIGLVDVINHEDFSLEGIDFWNAYHIDREILEEYNVNQVKFLRMDNDIMIRIHGLAFSYRIGSKHKVYQPFDPEMKFRNNYPRTYVEGYYQIIKRGIANRSKVLFITKSTKDIMCYRKMNLDAIAPKAENQVIPDHILEELKKMYPYIFMVFDDDPAGRKGVTRYPFPAIWIPLESDVKDTADHQKKYGPEKTKQLLKQLITV